MADNSDTSNPLTVSDTAAIAATLGQPGSPLDDAVRAVKSKGDGSDTSDVAGQVRKYEKKAEDLSDQEAAQGDAITKAMNRDIAAVEPGVMDKIAALKPFKATPAPNAPEESSLKSFLSAGSIFGLLASGFTKKPFINGLNASAAAISAIKQGDAEGYKQAYQHWKDYNQLALDASKSQTDDAKTSLELLKTIPDVGLAQFRALGAKFNDPIMVALAEKGDTIQLAEYVQKKEDTALKVQEAHDKMLEDAPKIELGLLQNQALKEAMQAKGSKLTPDEQAQIMGKIKSEFDPPKASATGGGRNPVYTKRMITSAGESFYDLQNLMHEPISDDVGLLGMTDSSKGGVLQASKRALLNKMSDQDIQSYNVIMTGISKSLATLEANGLSNTQGLSAQIENAVAAQPGNTHLTKLLKVAEMRQIVDAALEPNLYDPAVSQSQKDEIKGLLDKLHDAVPFSVRNVQDLRASAKNDVSIADFAKQSGLGDDKKAAGGGTLPVPKKGWRDPDLWGHLTAEEQQSWLQTHPQ